MPWSLELSPHAHTPKVQVVAGPKHLSLYPGNFFYPISFFKSFLIFNFKIFIFFNLNFYFILNLKSETLLRDVFMFNEWGQNIFRHSCLQFFVSQRVWWQDRSNYIVSWYLWTTVFLLRITQNKNPFFTEHEWSYWLLIYLSNMTAAKQAEHKSWREERTSDTSIALLCSSDLHLLG